MCPLAGVYSRRRLCEIIVVVVVVDDIGVGVILVVVVCTLVVNSGK